VEFYSADARIIVDYDNSAIISKLN